MRKIIRKVLSENDFEWMEDIPEGEDIHDKHDIVQLNVIFDRVLEGTRFFAEVNEEDGFLNISDSSGIYLDLSHGHNWSIQEIVEDLDVSGYVSDMTIVEEYNDLMFIIMDYFHMTRK